MARGHLGVELTRIVFSPGAPEGPRPGGGAGILTLGTPPFSLPQILETLLILRLRGPADTVGLNNFLSAQRLGRASQPAPLALGSPKLEKTSTLGILMPPRLVVQYKMF